MIRKLQGGLQRYLHRGYKFIMKDNIWITFIAILAFSVMAFASFMLPNIDDFDAEISDNNDDEIILTWSNSDQSQLNGYEIYRRMDHEDNFRKITEKHVQAHGSYEYVDKSVFRGERQGNTVSYRLKGNFNGSIETLAETDINYTSSGVRRTWGSIKRMFQ